MANTFVSLRRLQQFYNGLKNKFALKSEVLVKTNTSEYTPTASYNPATKKYVDDAIDSMTLVFCTESEIDEMLAALGIVVDVVEAPVEETGGSD